MKITCCWLQRTKNSKKRKKIEEFVDLQKVFIDLQTKIVDEQKKV